MVTKVQLGFRVPSGEDYYVPIHHSVFTGMTTSGKTTAEERILREHQGKSLVFLTKRGEKIFQDAPQIPPYYRERFDWEYLRSLLEATMREKLKFETPWIIRLSKQTQVELTRLGIRDLEPGEALEIAYKLLTSILQVEKLRDFDRNIYTLLHAYLAKVLPHLKAAKYKFTPTLELHEGLSCMDLIEWYTQEQIQMLCMRAAMEYLLEEGKDTITALPEAWKILPQGRNTPVKLIFEKYVREGATNGNYLYIDAQDLRGVDKTHLGQCYVWVIGKMIEANEVERLLKQTLNIGIKAETIQKLPLGHFVVVNGLENTVDVVYVWPWGAPKDLCREVAKGHQKPEVVQELLQRLKDERLRVKVMEVDDLVWKEKFEEEKRKREELEKESTKQVKRLSELKVEVEEAAEKIKAAQIELELERKNRLALEAEYNQYVETAKANSNDMQAEMSDLQNKLETLQKDAEAVGKIREGLLQLIPTPMPINKPSEVSVSVQPTLTEFTVKVPKHETIEATDKDVTGQILILASKGWFKERRRTTQVRDELKRVFNCSPRPGTIETALGDLTAKGILEREREGTSWIYWLAPEAEKLIKVEE